MNLFAMKMAGVFMISTCTIGLRSAIFPRWIAFAGYACALVLLLVIANWKWIELVFPLWMLLVSMQILLAEFRSRHAGEAAVDTVAVSTNQGLKGIHANGRATSTKRAGAR